MTKRRIKNEQKTATNVRKDTVPQPKPRGAKSNSGKGKKNKGKKPTKKNDKLGAASLDRKYWQSAKRRTTNPLRTKYQSKDLISQKGRPYRIKKKIKHFIPRFTHTTAHLFWPILIKETYSFIKNNLPIETYIKVQLTNNRTGTRIWVSAIREVIDSKEKVEAKVNLMEEDVFKKQKQNIYDKISFQISGIDIEKTIPKNERPKRKKDIQRSRTTKKKRKKRAR